MWSSEGESGSHPQGGRWPSWGVGEDASLGYLRPLPNSPNGQADDGGTLAERKYVRGEPAAFWRRDLPQAPRPRSNHRRSIPNRLSPTSSTVRSAPGRLSHSATSPT